MIVQVPHLDSNKSALKNRVGAKLHDCLRFDGLVSQILRVFVNQICSTLPIHTVKNPQLLRHSLKIDNLIFAPLSNFMKQYSRIYLLGHFSEKCSQIFLKTKQERTIKI